MTSYANFIQEFPRRCRDILVAYEEDAKGKDREVTLLVTVATSAFTIPFERLNPSSPNHIADDRYPEAVSALGRLQNRDFADWQAGRSWRIIEGLDGGYIRTTQADAWAGQGKWQPIPTSKKVGSILSILRNALAHGSIFTFPRPISREKPIEIEVIIFLSRLRDENTGQLVDKYNAVKVSSADFRALILDWISFLESLQLPSAIMQENI